MDYVFHPLTQDAYHEEKADTRSKAENPLYPVLGRCRVDWVSFALVLGGSFTAVALAAIGLYSAHVAPIKLYGDGSSSAAVYEVLFGVLASVCGGLIAAGAASAFGAFFTRRLAKRGAPVREWIHAPDSLRGRPSFSAGPMLFALGIAVAVVYSMSHAAATTLLAPVRTIFNQTLPGVYTVGTRFDVSAQAMDTVTGWDLIGAADANTASIRQHVYQTLQWYPLYLALGLDPSTSHPRDVAGPVVFPSTTTLNTLNTSQYLVVWAPHVQANCSATASCARLAEHCSVDAGWSKQVAYRLPDTSLVLGPHEGDQNITTKRFDLTKLTADPAFQSVCSRGFGASVSQLQELLSASTLSAFNHSRPGTSSSSRRRDTDSRASHHKRADLSQHPRAPAVTDSYTTTTSSTESLVSASPAFNPISIPASPSASINPAVNPGQAQTGQANPVAFPATAPTTVLVSVPGDAPSGPGSSSVNYGSVAAQQDASATSSSLYRSQTAATSPIEAAVSVQSGVSPQSAGATTVPSTGFFLVQTQTSSSAATGAASATLPRSGGAQVSQATTTAIAPTAPNPNKQAVTSSGDEHAALHADAGVVLDGINYWCIFVQPAQEWYCMLLCVISAATLAAGVASLKMPVGVDLSRSASVSKAVARSPTVCSELREARRYAKNPDQRISWVQTADGQSRLFPSCHTRAIP